MEFKNQRELFEHKWNNSEHISEFTGKPLLPKNHFKWHWQFVHVLGKGPYPAYKLRLENIMLALPEEHEKQEQFEAFINKRDELKPKYYKEIYGKKF